MSKRGGKAKQQQQQQQVPGAPPGGYGAPPPPAGAALGGVGSVPQGYAGITPEQAAAYAAYWQQQAYAASMQQQPYPSQAGACQPEYGYGPPQPGAASSAGGQRRGQGHSCGGGCDKGPKGKAETPQEKQRRRRREKKTKKKQEAEEEDDDDEDLQHFMEVCWSLVNYGDDSIGELQCTKEALESVDDPHELALLMPRGTNEEMLAEMHKCAAQNARFLALLVESDEDARQYARIPNGHEVQERNMSKARTVLRQFVRDWSDEGKVERETQYGALLTSLEQYIPLPADPANRPRVLCPGSGLSRLPFEVASRGYAAQGNEFSYHMLQGSKWVLNETVAAKTHAIFPYVLSLEHRNECRSHLSAVMVPDVCPSQVLCGSGAVRGPQDFSMCAGEFVEVYCEQKAEWDAMLTCFFIDTARNIFLYIRTIAYIVRPGGLWSNFGPLLFHYAEQADGVSIELSWEEIRPAIAKYFDFKEEEARYGNYTTNKDCLFHTRYNCMFFAAIRNDTPVDGKSFPVF